MLIPHRTGALSPPGFGSLRGFDRFFDELWRGVDGGPSLPSASARFAPAVDIRETEAAWRIVAELPGVTEKDFELVVENGVLTLQGEKRSEREESKEGYRYVETAKGRFERRFRLPEDVDPDAIEAGYRDGLLTVTLPKSEAAKARNIPVTAS